jgi:hypothetical protein
VPVLNFSKKAIMKSIKFFAVATLCAAALSSAAYAAPASFANNGEISAPVTLSTSSTIDRAAVRAQGVEAAHQGQIATGDLAVVRAAAPMSTLARAEVRAQGQQALLHGDIATGDLAL